MADFNPLNYECPYKVKQRCHRDCLAFDRDSEGSEWEHCRRLIGDTALWYSMTEDGHLMVDRCQ